MDAPYEQSATGLMTYPVQGTINRLLFKMPLILWRSGLGGMLGESMLVLTTWGRKSRLPRHTMLSYTPMNDRIYLAAGWGEQCDWYQNLLADPHVLVQVWSQEVTGSDAEVAIPAIARRVTGEEEFRQVYQRLFENDGGDRFFKPWLKSLGIAYDLEDTVAKRERVHQVALDLQAVDKPSALRQQGFPPAMEADLKWMWAVVAGSFWLGWLMGRRKR